MKHARSVAFALTMAMVAGPAFAHSGHLGAGGLVGGLAHPLLGLDHELAMTALGLWAAARTGRSALAPIISFMAAMALGAFTIHWPAAPLAAIEPMMLASVIVLGLLVAAAARLPDWAACLIAALFGLAHGAAHGLAGAAGPGLVAFVLGMLVTTAGLHAAGYFIGVGIMRLHRPLIMRALGAAAALAGVGIVLAGA